MKIFGNLSFITAIVCAVAASFAHFEHHSRDFQLLAILTVIHLGAAYRNRDRAPAPRPRILR